MHVFQNKNQRCSPKSDRRFFLTLTVTKKSGKNMGVRGYFLKNSEAMHAELNEKAEAVTRSYSAAIDF